MDWVFNSDETLIRDSVRRYFDGEYGFDARRARIAHPQGFSRETWQQLADLGVLALPLSTGSGGLGAVGLLIVAEACGRALVVEPWLSTLLVMRAIELGGSQAQRETLDRLTAGEAILAFAHEERAMRYDVGRLTTTAEPSGEGLRLRGEKALVLHGAAADQLLVSARTGQGVSLVIVDAKTPGVRVQRYTTADGLPAADVAFDDVVVPHSAAVGAAGEARDILDRLLDHGATALSAEAVGVMDALLTRTLTYLGTRQQFGQPLARFQALQHRVADMAMEVEQARSMALVAALANEGDDVLERQRAVSAAKARVNIAAKFVGEHAVQLHGGIGMTDELDVSHYFKRLTMISRTYGDADHHLGRYLSASGR